MAKYKPQDSEIKWQEFWQENQIYKYDYKSDLPTYSIDTPPPTVSGKIHIGHIFSYTQAEVIARYKRMNGYNVFYPFGFDDNGLPTEKLVEKEIKQKASNMDRKEFVDTCLKVTEKYRGDFKTLWKSIGISADWDLEYSTISEYVRKLSQKSFLKLLADGLIIKKNAPALWCTGFQTSVAQAEVESKEFNSEFHDLVFNLEDGTDVIVATTRPELLPACVCVFVNPDDERYTNLIGKKIITPLGIKVDILTDEKVELEKGSGVVMCCTYGDDNDLHWKKKHNLPEKIILNPNGTMKDTNIEGMDGLHLKKARPFIVNKLKEIGKLTKSIPIKHPVNVYERSGVPIEIIPVAQWFINILPLKEKLIENANKINWYPEYMKKRYIDWVENLKWDWCISRQRFYGVSVPVWTSKKTGEMILPDEADLPVDPIFEMPKNLPEGHTIDDIEPDRDVLDTWATSSLSPEINYKWEEEDSLESKIRPMDLRPQAHDIIRTWALYTIIKSELHHKDIPWENIMISGHVLFKKGEKISKSKNQKMMTPEQLIKTYSADAVRSWACRASLGKDIQFDEQEIKNGKKLVTKVWNVSNFALMHLNGYDPNNPPKLSELEKTDIWILDKTQEVINKMIYNLDKFEFGVAMSEFEKFFWHDFCDYYLEIIKERVYKPEKFEDGERKKKSVQYALYTCLNTIIKLIAPYLPHISEEIYQNYFKQYEKNISIHKSNYPKNIVSKTEDISTINNNIECVFALVEGVRKFKTENKIRLGEEISQVKIIHNSKSIDQLKDYQDDIIGVTRAKSVEYLEGDSFSFEFSA